MRLLIRLLLTVILTSYLPSGALADVEFDLFFTDKKTRMQLNQAREQHSFITPRGNAVVDGTEDITLPNVKFDGMIIRNDGSAEVWINSAGSSHEAQLGNQVETNARRTNDGGIRITLPSGKTIKLKPGQVYSMETERVREVYEQINETPDPVAATKGEEEPAIPETTEKTQSVQQPAVGFNEAALAEEPDAKIELLEERVQKLEQAGTEN